MPLIPKPVGARILVKDEIPLDDYTARAQKAGLVAVVYEQNLPKPTTGLVVAIGGDPFIGECGVEVGKKVMFGRHAGTRVLLEGEEYRSLDIHEVIMVLEPQQSAQVQLPPVEQ